MAAAICTDLERTELAVEQAFAEAAAVHATGRRDLRTAWLLSSVYRHATRQARISGQCYAPFSALTEAQAEVLALTRLGCLDSCELTEHLDVPRPVIARVLLSALRALQPA